jgi:hypothetical protein
MVNYRVCMNTNNSTNAETQEKQKINYGNKEKLIRLIVLKQ